MRSIPIWKNGLVFSELTKQTSVSILRLPAIVVYCIRWCRPDIELPDRLDCVSWIVYQLVFYMFWQMMNQIVAVVLQWNVIYEEGYMTSLRRLTQEKLHGAILFMHETPGTKKPNIFILTMAVPVHNGDAGAGGPNSE